MELALKTRTVDEVVVLSLTGRIVFKQEAQALCDKIAEVLQSNRQVVISLAGVECVDGSGLGALAHCVQMARDRGRDVKFSDARPHIQDLLDLTRLSSVLDLYDSEQEAVRAFGRAA